MTDREAFDAFIKDSECIHVPSALAAWQAALESALGKIRADVQAAGLANGGIESAADVVPEILSQMSEKIEAATATERERNQFDKRRTADDFTTVVANALHFFDAAEKTTHPIGNYSEILDSHKGSIERYRNDAIFHAKVTSIVAQLLRVLYEPDLADKIRSGE